jgi:hypothetical protein
LARQFANEWRVSMLDVWMLALGTALFACFFGYAALCDAM